MSPLVEAAKAAWMGDDGQSTARDIASRVLAQAVARGELPPHHGLTSALESILVEFSSRVAPEPALPAVEVALRKAEDDWSAAVSAARRPTVVHDEDGGTSVEMRVPSGWTHEDCATLGQYLRKVAAGYAETQSAKASDADEEAARFVAALPDMAAEQAKAAYWGLSKAARLSGHIRALPKSVRRQF